MSDEEFISEHKDCEVSSESFDGVARDEIVDPRIQIELERLNTATDLINKLEIELDEARSNFRLLLSESSLRVNQLAKKLGSCVEKATPYYEARMQAKQLQAQTQKAALRYERASSAHCAAKEMVYLAEEGLKKEGRCFDPAWQEMLNHATLRVNEAESERVLSQHEHQKTSLAYNEVEKVIQQLHQELKKSIVKSSLSTRRGLLQLNNLANQHQLQLLPYFEMKAQFNHLLEEQRKKVHHLEENVLKIKMSYADALHNLEEISDEIHMKRKKTQGNQILHKRCEVVGAESPNFSFDEMKIPYYKLPSSSASCEDMYLENINSEDMYMSLPAKLKARPGLVVAACMGNSSQIGHLKASYLPTFQESVKESLKDGVQSKSNKRGLFSNETKRSGSQEKPCLDLEPCGSDIASNRVGKFNLCIEDNPYPSEALQDIRDRSPEGQEIIDHKLLAPDFNILRVQREELSDSESLASNDTADTLDDNQIECLLLDKVLPLDVENDKSNLFRTYKSNEELDV